MKKLLVLLLVILAAIVAGMISSIPATASVSTGEEPGSETGVGMRPDYSKPRIPQYGINQKSFGFRVEGVQSGRIMIRQETAKGRRIIVECTEAKNGWYWREIDSRATRVIVTIYTDKGSASKTIELGSFGARVHRRK